MKILYLGHNNGTSKHRADALRRNGHDVEVFDPTELIPKGRIAHKFHFETGNLFCEKSVGKKVLNAVVGKNFDIVWVCNGVVVGPGLIVELQRRFGKVMNYNHDDPYGRRDRFAWLTYLRAVPYYDLLAVVRLENVREARNRGAKKVVRIYRSADEAAHAPLKLTSVDWQRWGSDVSFVGTAMPERGPFMARLIELGVPLSIYGDRWQRLKEWSVLKRAWKGPGTKNDEEYAKAIQCSKICLGLVSKGNRDLHTTRSLEIPNMGGLFCAMRTSEHLTLYKDGEEAVFWDDADECAAICKALLADEPKRKQIAAAGLFRCEVNGNVNQKMTQALIDECVGMRESVATGQD
jgi:hypothetical protein